ncbi:MAG: GDSL-type esterase/lipase family protein [Cyclobacteriaceae bacterium]
MKGALTFAAMIAVVTGLCQHRSWDTIPHIPDHWRELTARFEKEPVVTERIIFLGNSITEGGNWKRLLKDSTIVNRGIGGDITFGILQRLADVVKRKPTRLFLLIGINDLSKGIPDEVIIENIFAIVMAIRSGSPLTRIYVQSILPTNASFESFPQHYNKDDHVVAINGQLEKYAKQFGFEFINLYPKFLDKEGRLDAQLSHDGLHLNEAGYQRWVEVLKTGKYL